MAAKLQGMFLFFGILLAVSCVNEEEIPTEYAAKPTVNVPNGCEFPYFGGTVTLGSATAQASIYYTLDGSDPVQYGSLVTGPVRITQNVVLKAVAKKAKLLDSDVLEVSYTLFSSGLTEYARSMKIGWNLGNTFDGHNGMMPRETQWQGVVTTQELMDRVAQLGFGAVRIPVTWGRKLGNASELGLRPSQMALTVEQIEALVIDAAWLDRVQEVVDYVLEAGMKAMLNIHHDGADSRYWLSVRGVDLTGTNKDRVDAIFRTLWTQIAERFKNYGEDLIFEGFNELHDGNWGYTNPGANHAGVIVTTTAQDLINQYARVNELNQIFVNTVRATGGNNAERYLVVSGLVTRPSLLRHLEMPADSAEDKLIVNFHYYDPYDFSGSAAQSVWGSRAHSSGWANEAYVRNTFNDVRNRFANNNIPVIIGEYGAVRQNSTAGKAHRLYYVEYVTKHAVDCGFIPFWWDNGSRPDQTGGGEQFGLFNRDTLEFSNDAEDIVKALMRAVNEDYLLSDIVAP